MQLHADYERRLASGSFALYEVEVTRTIYSWVKGEIITLFEDGIGVSSVDGEFLFLDGQPASDTMVQFLNWYDQLVSIGAKPIFRSTKRKESEE